MTEPNRENDERQHRVTLTNDFWLQATEVTQSQWRTVMGNNPSHFQRCGGQCPVDNVNWYEAVSYCNELSRSEGLPECYRLTGCRDRPGTNMLCTSAYFGGLQCRGYRLPTEAEWEYAARAGTTGPRYGQPSQIAWHRENSGRTTHPVKSLSANDWGLYDILGNVWEWCNDWYDADYPSGAVTDPLGPGAGSRRVERGGSWYFRADDIRAARRRDYLPGNRRNGLGFRPARTLP